ncbi:ABC transporter transmembrane domain-containing protein [Microbacterium sp. NPDC056052]|uniref:ABC transporter transmembrane domain-containing protein n=1 Tax=Microbacterium sp. NPDC056052 TaxID=3345695 RepID=UPI0035E16D2C
MIALPEKYVPPPARVTPVGFLAWLIRMQWTTVLQGVVCDVIWLLGLALTPWAIGRAVDEGLVAGDYGAFLRWLGVVVWLQLQHSLIQGLRDRAGSINFARAYSRLEMVLARSTSRVTIAAEQALAPGAVVTMAAESWSATFLPINVGSITSALVAFVTVSVLLLRDSVMLGLFVIVGVPLFSAASFLLVRTLNARSEIAWGAREAMNAVALDSVKGLRVLRGVGGEQRFLGRYRERSAELRVAGIRLALPRAAAEALNLLIPGLFVAGLTWVGAVLVSQGQLQVGALVAFYGYAGFLVLPVALINQAMTVAVDARVAARRIVGLLALQPLWTDGTGSGSAPEPAAEGCDLLRDDVTGLVVREGELLGVVVSEGGSARALVDRVGRLLPDDGEASVLLRGRRLEDWDIAAVRERIVVSDPVPFLFSGTLREVLDPWGRHGDDAVLAAVAAVDASDIVKSVPGGLDVLVGERGVEFSGGQRQRLGAARALLAEPELLVMHDPTSSVDAPTEERMSSGIRSHRRGRSTMIVTTSPLVLALAARVVLIVGDRIVADGTHSGLLESHPEYRALVMRAEGVER